MKTLLGLTIIVVMLNAFLGFISAAGKGYELAGLIGYVFGSAFTFPLIIVGITAIWKKNRNRNTLLKYFFWASVVALLVEIVQLVQAVQQQP